MPKVSKQSAAHVEDHGPVLDRYEEIDDGYTISFTRFNEEIDSAPLMKGLPDDRCHCAHWGYVLEGRVSFAFPDREEVFEAGDAFYVPPGHHQHAEAGTEYLQFSPTRELREVGAKIMENMQAMA